MAEGAEPAREGEWEDARVSFLERYYLKSTKLKDDKWKKMLSVEENKQMILNFLEKSDHGFILFSQNARDDIVPSFDPPSSLKKKSVYFVKRRLDQQEPLKPATIKKDLIYGDLSYTPLEHLSAVVDDVYLPMLMNQRNHTKWPAVVAQDVLRHIHRLKSSVYVVAGQVKGKTLLPLPVGTESDTNIDKNLVHAIESAIIDWTHQIRDVLKSNSAAPLLEGLNPGPLVELDFWAAKAGNLQCIYDQLRNDKIMKMAMVLEKSKSSYYPAFKRIFEEVVAALMEAKDINIHLKPLRPILERMNETEDFKEMAALFGPLMHTLSLIWQHSKYYNTPTRLIVLLQEVCNEIIEHARSYLEPENIFKLEPDDAKDRVETTLEIFDEFYAVYHDYKARINEKSKEAAAAAASASNGAPAEGTVRPWVFEDKMVFVRLEKFQARIRKVLDFFATGLEFIKLEKVEIGGVKGKQLSNQLQQIFKEFEGNWQAFGTRTYDPLDPNIPDFEDDFDVFSLKIRDLDRRLASVISQGFDDCSVVESVFKLFDSFAGLLDRQVIRADIEQKYTRLLSMFSGELDDVKAIFNAQKASPPVHKNQPTVAGSLSWSHELRARIEGPMRRLKELKSDVLVSAEAEAVFEKFNEMTACLNQFDDMLYNAWSETVGVESQKNLERPLLSREGSNGLLTVNFDSQLVALLREVKYLESLGKENIPQSAAAIFAKSETFRQYVGNLDLMVKQYNRIRETVIDVEAPLIERRLKAIDEQLKRGLSELNWNSEGIQEYIATTKGAVEELAQRLQKAKSNVEEIDVIMANWYKAPLIERAGKKGLLNIAEKEAKLAVRYDEIRAGGQRIHALLRESCGSLEATEGSQEWRAYADYVDDLVVEGFFKTIHCSLLYLLQNMDAEYLKANELPALMEARFELIPPHLVFTPSMDDDHDGSVMAIIETILRDIYRAATLVPRLASHSSLPDYARDMDEMVDLTDMKSELLDNVNGVMNACIEYRNSFDVYGYLWTDDRQEFLAQFLRYGKVPTPEEIEAAGEEGLKPTPPTLEQYKRQIDTYEKIYTKIQAMNGVAAFDGWFRVDAKPFKATLSNIVKKWSYMFIHHQMDHVTTTLSDLSKFIKDVTAGLSHPIAEGDYKGLVDVMGLLLAVRERTANTDEIFEPLKQTVALLKTYDVDMNEEVHNLLAELPDHWANLKKTATSIKHEVAPLQASEVAALKKKCDQFELRNFDFREHFLRTAPFKSDIPLPQAYRALDRAHRQTTAMEEELRQLEQSASLFEVALPEYKQLRTCRKEISLLKVLWDMIGLVTYLFDDWRTTLWRAINVEAMELESKKFVKDIRALDKEVRAWDAFIGLDSTVKNMITSLRAVGELQNPAIRERHWQQLMHATKVKFCMSDETRLNDLLALNLHNFEDEVRSIVDRATKELSMEKILSELDKTWSGMEFEYEKHPRTSVSLIRSSEELVETLEDNQVVLQNLMTSKYVAHFLEQVSRWQRTLSTVDSVITIWFEVQRTWSHLESIFIGSEDIRNQLPEDSKRFDGIDSDWKELMGSAEKTPNVVEACCKPGLFEMLEGMQTRLALCEKALAEYLETKRLAFPRFYFVSSTDLLDILSKGNQPEEVAKHLSKLFDNMAQLKFETDASGKVTKRALGMYSKEKEYVEFTEPCDCSGQVERWLSSLMQTMRATLRNILTEAVVTYEEKPREQWIFDYAGQIALAGTQIWWTTEVNIGFERLEEGYENALKEYYKKQVSQLTTLITMIQGELSRNDRQKIMTICTIDVHARDIVMKLIQEKAESAQAFSWQSQLRHRWDDEQRDCFANICDAQFRYWYEYLGNTPRLVITPLTDRCYITLTQSLHLVMGGAPAGPAGTGKTETTKDLGRALGMMVYVFNCSEQMDYKSCGDIYKGLAQTGAWGCFDEFNRISIEVLSVVAVQVKSITDGLRAKKKRFIFQGEEISLESTVGIFITMNPGYAGRTELPENIKALFRPCAMVVPDFELICEIMLMAEGFIEAKTLARKFVTLYGLNKELLSKQDHYDWGLRAIKSVLVVAGTLKRSEPDLPEENVLMRALRDFNLPKIVSDDVPVFMGLIGDLFPKVEVPRKRDLSFEDQIRNTVSELKLQPEDNFVLKVVQLDELLAVRHCVFVLGSAGTGKTQVWKTLAKTYTNMGRKAVVHDLDPKAVTNDELFGYINPATREWKDGLFSTIMREMASMSGDNPKWILLDGDIDPMWIESLNTVMDDNKVLTLASNERIPLVASMRLVFEIGHLKCATPATVSRAGILYLNPTDLGWNPFVQTWIDKREVQSEKANLTILFDKYLPSCLEKLRTGFKKITPMTDISMIQTLCYLLEGLLTEENVPPGCDKEWYEIYFVFAAVWAFGGAMFQDQLVDYRVEFSKWWQAEFRTIKYPSAGTVFDYCIDHETKKFVPWAERVAKYEHDPEMPLQSVLVATAETTRLRFFIDLLTDRRRPVLLVGNAGCGKTVLVQNKMGDLDDDTMVVNIPFNHYTTSAMLQGVLEKPLEKKAGRNYGPPGSKRLIYFIDDLNMPEVDAYGTVQPHTLMRQHLDYSHWYDRAKLSLKEIHNCQYVACMNPTAGSFTINPRLQRHFAVFAVSFPGMEALQQIYSSILAGHMQGFVPQVTKMADKLVTAALALHHKVSSVFLPTAVKFHYTFNLRDLSNIFQGMLFSTAANFKTPTELVRLWLHEASRVYGDKLIVTKDQEAFAQLQADIVKKYFDDLDMERLKEQPCIYCHFATGVGEPKYQAVEGWARLKKILEEALDNYNEVNAAMNLVLFEDAMHHVCRINRILENPRGNALLVGVGGSGKQSLARLAAFISGLEVFQITLRKGYGIPDLKTDLAGLYTKAGIKNVGMVFMMTDSQVADERFLVLINDLLASGEIPELFPDDEVENIISSMRNEVKGAGLVDTRDNCWKFFISKVRRNLKVVLCFSPVGTILRVRCRKFPAIVNCTNIDWFHEWPEEALNSVSARFLEETELVPAAIKGSVSNFMAFVHRSVNEMSKKYLANERRYNYTTPKSFLEQIKLYKTLLDKKNAELIMKMDRLENGLTKLKSTAAQVDDLKQKLAAQEVELKEKNEEADKLIQKVAEDTEKVNREKAIADEEEVKVGAKTAEVKEKQMSCEADLARAEPALAAAQEALNTLNKANLTELKSFGQPPEAVKNVTAAVMVLMAPAGKIPKDRSWKAGKAMMAKVDQFLDALLNFDKEHIDSSNLEALRPYLADEMFVPDLIRSKSLAAAGLCSWVINIVKFYEVYCDVEPKRQALSSANEELAVSQAKLAEIKGKIKELDDNLSELKAAFEHATSEKLRCEEEAKKTQLTLALANRLINGLASEKVRWAESVEMFKQQEKTLPGDVLLISAFVSYVGCFSKQYRLELMNEKWLPYMLEQEVRIPITEGLDPLSLLTDDAKIASWNNEGLPNDRVSIENATILTNAERWPLMIDPQLQGINWIKTREGAALRVVRVGQRGYLDIIEKAVSGGDCVLLENIGETLDPVLDALLGRNTIKKGKYIKIGDKEVEYSPNFRLILHTKLANPHYKPEMQAQTTLINFTVTRDGLEDQLLADVVSRERPDLEKTKAELTKQQNDYKIKLKELEDALLARLSAAEGNFLGDTALVENLETTKRTAAEIEVKVAEAKNTELNINEARENYRPVAARSSLLYFILNDLYKINLMYQFSLKAFTTVFHKAIDKAQQSDDLKERVEHLIDSITYSVFVYTTRGLFERDKLIFTAQMAFSILQLKGEIVPDEFDFLLRCPAVLNVVSPVDFLSNANWGSIKSLSQMEAFRGLDKDIEGSAKRWKKFCESEVPEKEKFPQEWKNKTALQKLCMLRALRPDRMTYAVADYVEEKLGSKYTDSSHVEFQKSFEESDPCTPIFFILSPGVDPLKDVEVLGKLLGFTMDSGKFHNVSLGQGQEVVAEQKLDVAMREGHWVILQNIHLVAKWLPQLEKRLDQAYEGVHPDYRVFLSAEPASIPSAHVIPQGILQSSIKITNEPPTGMKANLHRALDNFNQETLESCAKEAEFKSILFSLCYFHAVVIERRKFGPQGWNRPYPFNVGDLTISVNVLFNYLEANPQVPWTDLRYLFGQIMYGGHITDDWDRRLCRTYLEEYMKPEQLDGDLEFAPGFSVPGNNDYRGYHTYIDEMLPPESPYLYGLHPNAEIGFLTMRANNLFQTILEMMPQDTQGGDGSGSSKEEKVKQCLDEIMEKLPDEFNMTELQARSEEKTPYVVVALQECERMNILTRELRRSLLELDLGLKGDLTISETMETLMNALYLDKVPDEWAKLAFPSTYGLAQWFSDLLLRIKELESWVSDFNLPNCVWLSGLFNPQSFLTAIMQTTARKNEWPLDKMTLHCEVTKKNKEDINSPPRDGAYIYGLFMEGARWDVQTGMIQESRLKELTPTTPVMFIKAITVDKKDTKGVYECPVYRTRQRGPTYVWSFNLKTKEKASKWIMAGVALLLSI